MATGNKLGRFLGKEGGINFETAVNRADNAMQMIRPEVEANVDEVTVEIGERVNRFPAKPTESQLRDLQKLATQVAGLAGLYDRDDLGQAAYHLCELLDLDLLCGRYDGAAVCAHVQTMLLLRTPDRFKALDRVKMVAALRSLVEHARQRAKPQLAALDRRS